MDILSISFNRHLQESSYLLIALWFITGVASVTGIVRAEEKTEDSKLIPAGMLMPFENLIKPPPEKLPVTDLTPPPAVGCAPTDKEISPLYTIAADWTSAVDGYSMTSVDVSATTFLPPPAGPFPITLTPIFSYTGVESPDSSVLPGSLFDLSIAGGWVQPLNQQWLLKYSLALAIASDFENQSSDMWQVRGGVVALYNYSDEWRFAGGALATGRKDIPVMPAGGLTWTPSKDWKIDLMFPRPRVMYLLSENYYEKNWCYLETGIDGGAWAFERPSGLEDFATYREWKFVVGCESNPVKQPGELMAQGVKFAFECGMVFDRTFEFDSGAPEEEIGSAFKLRGLVSF